LNLESTNPLQCTHCVELVKAIDKMFVVHNWQILQGTLIWWQSV